MADYAYRKGDKVRLTGEVVGVNPDFDWINVRVGDSVTTIDQASDCADLELMADGPIPPYLMAVAAHKARADQQEARAVEAEQRLARFGEIAEDYERIAGLAAMSQRNADLVTELRRRVAALEKSADRARAAERERIRRGVLARELILQHPEDGDRVAVLTLDLEQIIGAEDGSDEKGPTP